MNYHHHAQEILELTTGEYITMGYEPWETDTNKKGTEYTQEVKLTTPKDKNMELYDYLTRKNYKVRFGTPAYVTGNERMLTIELKTSQAKRKEILTNRLSEDVFLFFENEGLL